MTGIVVDYRMTGPQEEKPVKFLWCLYKWQLAIPFDNGCQATRQGKHEFCAGEALRSHTEVRHSNARSAFCTNRRQPLVRNRLQTGERGHSEVACRQVLLKRESVTKVAVTRHNTNKVLPIQLFRLKVRRQEPVIDAEYKINLPVFQKVQDVALPRKEFELDLVAHVCVLLTQAWDYYHADGVRAGNAEGAFLPRWIEQGWHHEIFHLGQQALKLLKNLPSSQGELEASRRPDQKVILKHRACPLQRSAYRRLAQQ